VEFGNSKRFLISRACKKINVSKQKLKYAENAIGFKTQRDESLIRRYSEDDIIIQTECNVIC
jgi:DNA-binding transcriptional MerR regulator